MGANSCSKVPIAFRWFLTFSLTNLKSVRERWNGILWLVVNLSCDEGLAFCVIVVAILAGLKQKPIIFITYQRRNECLKSFKS